MIRLFILLGSVGIPCSVLTLALLYPETPYRWIFATFVVLYSFERVWETFYTSKERKPHECHGDWTLAWVIVSYLVLCFLFIFEYFLVVKAVHFWVSGMGLLVYLAAFRLRWWGMKSLGTQWSIHAVGAIKLKQYRLLRVGAYKYIRHPIYLGIILEEISLPLIANAYYSLIFALVICVPLVMIRAFVEEKSSARKFGSEYQGYQKEVPMFIPIHFIRRI